ncbi:hypothetical protein BBP40_002530 [Aspergillus hancockii]|nr:hypothetical protein BBP40_002530 [Aspergillus hancockii]
MPKKGGKSKNKNKGGKAGGAAAAAATKKVTDVQNPVTTGNEVEEPIATSEGEAGDVVTEAPETVTAAPATTVPDAAAPPASIEEPKQTLQGAVDKAETPPADKAGLVDGETPKAPGLSAPDEPLELTPKTLTSTVGTETSLPERPKETAVKASEAHVKRPYESSLTAKDDELPHKIAKVDDSVVAAGATSGHVAETGSLAKNGEILAEKGTVQPQIVPGLGADPNDNVSTVLNVPGLSSVEEKTTGPSTTGTNELASTEAPTSVSKADTTEKSKEPEVPKTQEKTPVVEPLTTAVAPTTVSEPAPSSPAELTTAAASSEATGAEKATAPSETDATSKAASAAAVAGTGAGTATTAPPVPAESVLKVPSSIHDDPGSKVTSGNKAAAQEAVSNVKQVAGSATDRPEAAAQKIPDESKSAPKVQPETAAVKDQLPRESQPAAKEPQEAAGIAKQPEEIQKPVEAKTKEPQAVQDARDEGAATAKKPGELKPEDIKKPEEARTKEPQAGQDAPAGVSSKPEEGKGLADQAKDTAETEANKVQDQAQETAKADAKAEKRKSGFFGWFKRKLGGGKA